MTTPGSLILDLDGKGLACAVTLNGITLAQHVLREHLARAVRLDAWVQDGANTITLAVGALPPLPDDAASPLAAAPPAEPRLVLRVREAPPEGEDRVLVSWQWPGDAPLPTRPVAVLTERFEARAAATWAWLRAAPLASLDAEDRRQVAGLLAAVHAALQRRDVDEVLRLQQLSLHEQALAAGTPPAQMLGSYAAFLRERMAAPDWTVRPVDWNTLRASALGDGRIHRITDARGAPPIVATAGGSTFAIDPCVSRIDGRWAIVR